jgi:hypothetical protein
VFEYYINTQKMKIMKTDSIIKPWHPGEITKEDFLGDYGLTKYALAKALKISHPSIMGHFELETKGGTRRTPPG